MPILENLKMVKNTDISLNLFGNHQRKLDVLLLKENGKDIPLVIMFVVTIIQEVIMKDNIRLTLESQNKF